MKTDPAYRRSACPVAHVLDIFGDRWTLLIVRDLMLFGRRRYRDFLKAGDGIATNILADRLNRLATFDVIASVQTPEDPRVKLYYLTDNGIDLAPIMVEMVLWGVKHEPTLPVPEWFLERAYSDREDLLRKIKEGLKKTLADPGSTDARPIIEI